jgi:MerR family copper efflux transcriptional regulator
MRIGEVSDATGITTKTLRFYEERGLLPAAKRASNGYREYEQDALARLDFIRRGRAAGLTLSQIGKVLSIRDSGTAPCAHVQDILTKEIRNIDDRIAELVALRGTVAALREEAGSSPACDESRICSYV